MIYPWEEKYNLGIEDIDQQHRKLLDIVNKLGDIIINNDDESKDLLKRLANELKEYGESHFALEEGRMIEVNYCDYEAHIKEHVIFRQKIEEICKMVEEQKRIPAIDFIHYLMIWFVDHVQIVDRRYVPAMMEKYGNK